MSQLLYLEHWSDPSRGTASEWQWSALTSDKTLSEVIQDLSQNVPTTVSRNVPTISKCPNCLKMSQLSQNVPTISKCPNFYQRVNLRAESNFLEELFPWQSQDCAGWLNLCEIMRKMLKYAKMCGKHQIMRKVAENEKFGASESTAPKRCLCV